MGGAQFALPGAVERLRRRPTRAGERAAHARARRRRPGPALRRRAAVAQAGARAGPARRGWRAPTWCSSSERAGAVRRARRARPADAVEPRPAARRGRRRAGTGRCGRRWRRSREAVRAGRVGKLALERIDGEPAIASAARWSAGRARLPSGPAPADAQRLSARAGRIASRGRRSRRASIAWRCQRRRPRRVGHKGAAHIEPGNTLASFDAALRHGVDMIELDVLSEHPDGSGALLVAHDYEDMHARRAAHASTRRSSTSRARRSPGSSSTSTSSCPATSCACCEALRELEPGRAHADQRHVPRRPRADPRGRAGAAPGLVGAARAPRLHHRHAHRRSRRWRSSPATARCCRAAPARALAEGRFDAIMAHWRVVTPALVRGGRRGRRRALRVDRRRRRA